MYNPEQEQLVKKENVTMIQKEAEAGLQMEHLYASAMQRQEERTETLQQSRFRLGGVTHKDGKEMTEVKRYQTMLTNAMKAEIPKDEAAFENILRGFENTYDELLKACQRYLETHKRPITASGKARLHLVKGTFSLAQQEKVKLREKATEFFKTVQKTNMQLVWGNVLGAIRGSEFDLDQMNDLQSGGAATSELLIITSNQRKFFYKKEEKLDTPEEEFKKRYMDTCTDEKDMAVYTELQRLMKTKVFGGMAVDMVLATETTIISSLKTAKTEQELQTICAKFLNILKRAYRLQSSLDPADVRTQHIMREALLRYELWTNRLGACQIPKIDVGESLSKRNVLTTRMAAVLHAPELVAHSNMATLHRSGLEKQEGIVMAHAKGEEFYKVILDAEKQGKKIVYTPEAMRQFSGLQLMDTVCGQIDRHYSNRFVTTIMQDDKVIITGVQGIDHDLSFGKLLYADVKQYTNAHLPIFEKKDGSCSIPALDEEMVAHLREITRQDLAYYLGDLLSEEYIDAMWDRMQGVLTAIDRTIEKYPELLVKKEDWNLEVARRFAASEGSRPNLYIDDAKTEDFVEVPKQQEKQK